MSSANLDLVRSIHAAWERGDYDSVEWAHPDVELVFADGPEPGSWIGVVAALKAWNEFLSAWDELLGGARILAGRSHGALLVFD